MVKISTDNPFDTISVYKDYNGYNEECCIRIRYIPRYDDETGYELSISPKEAIQLSDVLKKISNEVIQKIKETKMAKESKKAQSKVKKVMTEFKHGKLHSGSKMGPMVTKPKQAVAIGMSEARKKGMKVPGKK